MDYSLASSSRTAAVVDSSACSRSPKPSPHPPDCIWRASRASDSCPAHARFLPVVGLHPSLQRLCGQSLGHADNAPASNHTGDAASRQPAVERPDADAGENGWLGNGAGVKLKRGATEMVEVHVAICDDGADRPTEGRPVPQNATDAGRAVPRARRWQKNLVTTILNATQCWAWG
jgi:hypothetical protein